MKRILLLCAVAGAAGCVPHFKEADSYQTQFLDTYSAPDNMTPRPMKGDPYTFGGIAEGSGGLIARQSYATDNNAPDFRDATETGKMGETGRDRTQVPGTLPGEPTGTTMYLSGNQPNPAVTGQGSAPSVPPRPGH